MSTINPISVNLDFILNYAAIKESSIEILKNGNSLLTHSIDDK